MAFIVVSRCRFEFKSLILINYYLTFVIWLNDARDSSETAAPRPARCARIGPAHPRGCRVRVCRRDRGGARDGRDSHFPPGHAHRRPGPRAHDGPPRHQGAPPRTERQRERAGSRELRRGAGESLSAPSRSAEAEGWPQSDDCRDVVEGPAAPNRGGLREIRL